jgi:hypothetical protein
VCTIAGYRVPRARARCRAAREAKWGEPKCQHPQPPRARCDPSFKRGSSFGISIVLRPTFEKHRGTFLRAWPYAARGTGMAIMASCHSCASEGEALSSM